MPSDVRLAEILRLVRKHGWSLNRITGSHHISDKPDKTTYSVPVHHGKVKYGYYREIQRQIKAAN